MKELKFLFILQEKLVANIVDKKNKINNVFYAESMANGEIRGFFKETTMNEAQNSFLKVEMVKSFNS